MNDLRRIAILTVLIVAAAAASAQEAGCSAHKRMVDEAVPKSVGTPDLMKKLLEPAVGPQLTEAFNPTAAAEVFRDRLTAPAACGQRRKGDHHFDCRYAGLRGSALKVELERGRVTYLNRERSEKKSALTLADARAVTVARKAAEALGVPVRELSERPDVRALRVSAGTMEGDTFRKGESRRVELHVRFQRRVGDVPVAFSRFHAAIDARGDVARMHVRWPDFRLVRGLKASNASTRDAVVAQVLDEVDRDNRCGTLSRIAANVVYAQTAVVEGGEGMADDGSEEEAPSSEFVPALLVSVIPVEQKEDSGVPQMPVQNYVVPLLQGADRADKK